MFKLTKILFISALGLGLLAQSSPVQAKSCEGITFPDQIKLGKQSLLLNGMGVREATIFQVNVYVAGLYVGKRSRNGKAIAAQKAAKEMRLAFVRDVAQKEMADAIEEAFRKAAAGKYKKLSARIAQFRKLLPALKEGDSLAFSYVPGKGLAVRSKKRIVGTIQGADFAKAFFLIWLGNDPPNAGLKAGLLGGPCG